MVYTQRDEFELYFQFLHLSLLQVDLDLSRIKIYVPGKVVRISLKNIPIDGKLKSLGYKVTNVLKPCIAKIWTVWYGYVGKKIFWFFIESFNWSWKSILK